MLITSILEMQEFNGRLNSSNAFDDYKSSLRKAEILQIKPIIGVGLYNDLNTKYNSDPVALSGLSDDEKELLPHIQCAITWFAIAEDLPANLVITGKNGVQEMESQHAMAARKWGYFESKGNAQDNAEVFSEYLLTHLEANREKFPLFESFAMSDILVSSGTQMNEHVPFANQRRSYLKIKPSLKRIQRKTIAANISDAFLGELRSQHQSNSLTSDNQKAFDLATEALAFLGFADAILALNIIVAGNGLQVSSFTNGIDSKMLLGEKDRKERKAELKQAGQEALDELLCLLQSNLDKYPTYRDSGLYTPPEPPDVDESPSYDNCIDDPMYVFG